MNSSFAIKQMVLQGWPVLSILFVCSVISIGVIWGRWRAFREAKRSMFDMVEQIIFRVKQANSVEAKERVAQHEIMRCLAPLEACISILGTVASTAPFIGLLGTVIGIIKAFKVISMSMGGGPSVVANGIAEALITTAMGLVVAIPAVVAYNYFNRQLQLMEQQISLRVGDMIHGFSEQSRTS